MCHIRRISDELMARTLECIQYARRAVALLSAGGWSRLYAL